MPCGGSRHSARGGPRHVADPDIRLEGGQAIWRNQTFGWGGATPCGGSRHSARGGPRHVADPDIGLEGSLHVADPEIWLGGSNLICFPVSHICFFVGGRPKSIAKLDGGAMARFSSLD